MGEDALERGNKIRRQWYDVCEDDKVQNSVTELPTMIAMIVAYIRWVLMNKFQFA